MRLTTGFVLASGFSGNALAHTLPGDESSLTQLAHQLFSLHHLPAVALIVIAGAIIYRHATRRAE